MDNDLFKEDDDDISKVGSIDKDYHTLNHKTYLFYIDYDSSIGHFSTRLSIDLVYLPIGYYTMAFELYFLDKIDPNTVSIDARSGTLSQIKTTTKKSSDHARSIINFYKGVINPSFDDLDIDIILKNKSGESYEADTSIFVVVYGVSGTHNDVEISIWDRVYYIENKIVHFEAPIDLKKSGVYHLKMSLDQL